MPTAEENPYAKMAKQRFKDLIARKKELEADYTPEVSGEYAMVKKNIIKAAIELLKLGYLCSDSNSDTDDVCLLVDDEVHTIPRELIKTEMDSHLYNSLFGEEDENDKSSYCSNDDSTKDVFRDARAGYYPPFPMPYMGATGYYPPYPPMMAAPSVYGAEEDRLPKHSKDDDGLSDILKDISSIQRKVILLESERDRAKKEVNSLNIENIAIRKDLEETEARSNNVNEEKDILNSKLLESENSLRSTQASLSDMEKTLIKAEEDLQTKNKDLEELNEKHSSLVNEYKEKITALSEQHDNDVRDRAVLEQQKVNLEEKIKDSQERYNNLLNEKRSVEEKVKSLENTISQKNAAYEKLKISSEDEIRKLKHQLDEQISVVQEKLKKQIEEDKEEYIKLQNKHSEEIEELNSKHASEIAEINKKYKAQLEEAIHKAKKEEYNRLEDQLNQMKAQLDKAVSDSQESEKLKNNSKRDLEKVSNQKDILEKKIQSLESDKESLRNDLELNKTKMDELEQSNKKLSDLAYKDAKTGVGNTNLFNQEFPHVDINNLIFAMVSIRGMKAVNDSLGNDIGDNIIYSVASEIKTMFPKDKIYRIMGDKFSILATNSTLNSVQGNLIDLKRKLKADEIDIVYGTCVGRECSTHGEIIEKAERALREMKESPVNTDSTYANAFQSITPIGSRQVVSEDDDPTELSIEEMIMSNK